MVVVPILKLNKAKSGPLSYHPTVLKSNMSKFMERFVTMPINSYMGHNKLFNINQSGF